MRRKLKTGEATAGRLSGHVSGHRISAQSLAKAAAEECIGPPRIIGRSDRHITFEITRPEQVGPLLRVATQNGNITYAELEFEGRMTRPYRLPAGVTSNWHKLTSDLNVLSLRGPLKAAFVYRLLDGFWDDILFAKIEGSFSFQKQGFNVCYMEVKGGTYPRYPWPLLQLLQEDQDSD